MNDKHSSRLLASYAIFKGLFDNGKDSYGVIAEYLKKTISENGLYIFTIDDITQLLNKEYEFNIPNAIVKTSLNRIESLSKTGANYTVNNPQDFISNDFDKSEQKYQERNDAIVEELISYVEKTKQTKLNESEKTILTHSFCNYILDKHNGNEYLEYISSFILEFESNREFKEQIDRIREGLILYSGIKFNNDINNFGAWKAELVIYIETEILFHLAGFNGELFKLLALDLFRFINEINVKSGKKVIRLKYFKEVKSEIDAFFTRAKYLLEGGERPNPSATAMNSIVNGCKTPSDIFVKKTDFYELLKRHSIQEDDIADYFSVKNHRYNIINAEIVEKVSKEIGNDASDYLKFLNYISIHRKESNEQNFENIKAILLTGNSTTLKVAWNDLVKGKGYVPLATTLSFLTNKFWFKLNKGFGKGTLPMSFDIISKSQIILSTILNKKIGSDYAHLQEEFRKGTLGEEQVKARLVDLKNSVRKPEDIEKDSLGDVLQVITEDSLDKFIEEQAHFKFKVAKQIEENEFLKSELVRKGAIEADFEKTKHTLREQKEKQFKSLDSIKQRLDQQAGHSFRVFKLILAAALLVACFGGLILVNYVDWSLLEKHAFIVSLSPPIIFILYIIVTEKEPHPYKAFKKLLSSKKQTTFKRKYGDVNFDLLAYLDLSKELGKTTEDTIQQEQYY